MESNWPEVTLKDVLETIIDYRGKTPPKAKSGIPVLTAASVKNGRVLKDKVSYISEETYNKVTTRGFPRAGDVLITTEAPCGEVAPFPTDRTYHITRRIMALRGNPAVINQDYLLYTLLSSVCQSQIYSRVRGTTVPRVLKTDITGLRFKLPPLSYQESVGRFLSSIDRKIELDRQTNQTLEKMAQSLFKSWFVDFDPVVDNALAAGNPIPEELAHRVEVRKKAKALSDFQPLPEHIRNLFPSEFEQTGEPTVGIDGWVPKSWSLTPFGELLDKTIGGDWGKESIDEKHTKRCRIIRGTDIPNISENNFDRVPDRWVQEKKLKSRCLKHGDIVIEVSGGSPTQSTGRSIKITEKVIEQLGGIVAPASFCRLFRPSIKHLSAYLSEHLLYIYGEGKMWGYQNQSTGISNFQTKTFLASELLAVPNEKLLAEFEKTISNFDRKKYTGQTATLAALRDYLLPKLISGEIRLDFLTDGNANQEAQLQGV